MSRHLSRRSVISGLATGAMVLAAGTTGAGASTMRPISGRFHQHGFDGANTASTPHGRMYLPLRTFWRTSLDSVSSAPIVTDEDVLVLGFGDRASRIHALDRETGEHRWLATLGGWTVSDMLVATDEYALTAEILEPRVTALSLSDGATAWETTVDGVDGFRLSPRISDGTVYLADRFDGGIVAIDVDSGEVERVFPGRYTRFAVDDETLYGSRGSPQQDDHGLTFFDRQDLEDRFEYPTDGRPGQPTVGEGLVFVATSDSQIHAIEKDSGESRWIATADARVGALTLADGVVLAHVGDEVVALDAADGSEQWRIEGGTSRAVAAADVVYVGREGGLDAYDVDSGTQHQSFRDPDVGPLRSISVIANAVYGAVPGDSVVMINETTPSL